VGLGFGMHVLTTLGKIWIDYMIGGSHTGSTTHEPPVPLWTVTKPTGLSRLIAKHHVFTLILNDVTGNQFV
jgi:hypothetical protein